MQCEKCGEGMVLFLERFGWCGLNIHIKIWHCLGKDCDHEEYKVDWKD